MAGISKATIHFKDNTSKYRSCRQVHAETSVYRCYSNARRVACQQKNLIWYTAYIVRVALHVCCGVCAAGAAERLIGEGHTVLGFFNNPNVHPLQEYNRRLDVALRVAEQLGFPLASIPYQPEEWFSATGTLENEPEGGRRCEVCFRLRLKRTYLFMLEQDCDVFTTTLTISPHKNAGVIDRVGREIGGEAFLFRDFKKKGGFQRGQEMAKRLGLYRQHYCGCMYSMPKSNDEKRADKQD